MTDQELDQDDRPLSEILQEMSEEEAGELVRKVMRENPHLFVELPDGMWALRSLYPDN
jgi:hypothetical protein